MARAITYALFSHVATEITNVRADKLELASVDDLIALGAHILR